MKVFKNTLITLLAIAIALLCLAFFLGLQLAFVAGGAWVAMTVAGWFGWFAGVGWGTYFAIGVCFWAFTIIIGFPTAGKRAFVNRLYAEHKRARRAERKKKRESATNAFGDAFEEFVEAQFSDSK